MDFDFGRVKIELKSVHRARSIRMWFADKDTLKITKPFYVSVQEALAFVRSNEKWISSSRASVPQRVSLLEYLSQNRPVWLFDREYEVSLLPTKTKSPYFLQDSSLSKILIMHRCGELAKGDIEDIFYSLAEKSISERVKNAAEKGGFTYSRLSVRNQRGRWASRSTSGTLSFNWRMVLLPFDLQDYVIAHEFAHTKVMDHSVAFWIFLSRICPNAKALDKKVSTLSREIFRIGD